MQKGLRVSGFRVSRDVLLVGRVDWTKSFKWISGLRFAGCAIVYVSALSNRIPWHPFLIS